MRCAGLSMWRLCLIGLAALWLGQGGALADAQSRRLIQEGARAFDAGDLATALDRFRAARSADPRDGNAVFYLGAVANRQGRFDAALAALTQARGFVDRHPDLDFELGWALHGLGRQREALAALEAYERAHPGRGKTSEFRGRAHAALGEYDAAERLLAEALARDPGLAATVRLQRAAIAANRQQNKRAKIRGEFLAHGQNRNLAFTVTTRIGRTDVTCPNVRELMLVSTNPH